MIADFLADLLQSCVAISAATILVLLLRKPLRLGLGARAAYAVWLLVPMAAIAVLVPVPTDASFVPTQAAPLIRVSSAMTMAMQHASATDHSVLLLVLWGFGALFTAFVFASMQTRFNRRIRRRAHRAYDEVDGSGPLVVGLMRPRIVLPFDFKQRYNAIEQTLVLAHEQIHLQRGDVQVQAFAIALRCVFWFNPLLHFAMTRFRFDQELSCDASVLKQYPASRRSYGDAMLKTQMAEFGLPIGCHWQSRHPLKERITMLQKPLPGSVRLACGSILVAALVLGGSLSAWAAQPVASGKHAATLSRTTPATPDATTPPHYPADAVAKHIGGKVNLLVLVGADGAVKNVKVESAIPAGVFDQSAINAAIKWAFHPATSHGKAVAGWVRVPVEFAPDDKPKTAKAG
jgi:TonB family protein